MEWKRFVSLLLTCAMLVTLAPAGLAEDIASPAEPSPAATEAPTATPAPTPTPVVETQEPTLAPATDKPSAEPTTPASSEPSAEPTAPASSEPSAEPTTPASSEPSAEPTMPASSEPSVEPSVEPTDAPVVEPTEVPENSVEPTEVSSVPVIAALRVDGETAFAVEYGMPEEDLASLLPATLTATLSDGATTLSLAVTWVCVDNGYGVAAYDPEPPVADAQALAALPPYTFRAQVADTQGYALAEGVDMPTLTVRLKAPEIMLLSIVDPPDMPEGMKYDDGQSRLELATGYTFTTEQINDAIAKVEDAGHAVKSIYNFATISKDSAAAISLPFTSRSPINGGTFDSSVTMENSSRISGGTFNGAVSSKGNITGGTFSSSVTLARASVAGGTFTSAASVTLTSASYIAGGDFYTDKIIDKGAIAIFDGTFHVPLTLSSGFPLVYGGTYEEPVTVPNGVTVLKGTFNNTVTNNGKITGGDFNGELVNNGTIEGNGATPTINGELDNANGTVKNAVFGGSAQITATGKLYVPFTVYGPSGEPEATVTDKAIYGEDALTALKRCYTDAANADWKLFLNGEESDLTGRTMSLDGSQNHFKHNSVWRIVGDVLEVLGDWDGADAPQSGYTKIVIYAGATLSGGKFTCSGTVTNNGTVSGGAFSGGGTFANNGTVSGGTFDNAKFTNAKEVTDGTFNGDVVNNGTISSGTFNDVVTNGKDSTISGGTFLEKSTVINSSGGTITGGLFKGAIQNSGAVSGGEFRTQFENYASGTILAGADGAPFIKGRLINNGTVEGGTVSATVDNYSTISGGSFIANNRQIMLTNDGTITGSATVSGWVTNNKTISGGTFASTSVVANTSAASITEGAFSGTVNNSGAISGGKFETASTVANANGASITEGTFSGTVNNSGAISGGSFSGKVVNKTGESGSVSGTISGGTFSGEVTNQGTSINGSLVISSTISGGSFSGSVINSGKISSGTFAASSTLHNSGKVTGATINGAISTEAGSSIASSCAYGSSAKVEKYAAGTIEIAYYIVENPGDPIGEANTGYYGESLIDALTAKAGALEQDEQWFWYPSTVSAPQDEITLVTNGAFELSDNHCVFVKHAQMPLIQWPAASAITYGQPLSASTLTADWPAGYEGRGSFKWTNDALYPTVDEAASTGYEVEFVPSDAWKKYYEGCDRDYMTEHVTLEVKPFKVSVIANDMGILYNSFSTADKLPIEYTVKDAAGAIITEYPCVDEFSCEPGQFTDEALGRNAGTYERAVPQAVSATFTNGGQNRTANYEITFVPGNLTIMPKPFYSDDPFEGPFVSKHFTFEVDPKTYTYTGQPCTPLVTVTDRGKELTYKVDYDLLYENNTNAGEATVTVKAFDDNCNYAGEKTLPSFTINTSGFTAELLTDRWTYTGSAITPKVSLLLDDGVNHAQEDDVEIAYANNINPGKATVTVTPKAGGNLTGDPQTLTFSIKKTLDGIDANDFAVKVDAQTYTGQPITPAITLTDKGETVAEENYEVAYDGNVNAGTAKVTVTGKGDYYGGTLTTYFIINPKPLTDADVTVTGTEDLFYNGEANEPEVSVKVGDVPLELGTDYTVEYFDNTDVGDAYLIVSGKGNYSGNVNKKFTISKANIKQATLSPNPIPVQTYTGSEIRPEITLTFNNVELTEDEDYTLSFTDNVKPGKASMTITGKGDFEGSIDGVTFVIASADIAAAELAAIPDQTYTGGEICPNEKIVLTFNGMTLKEETDYTLAFAKNTDVGEATVTITGTGSFTGVKTATFKIGPADIGTAKLAAIPDQTYTGGEICPNEKIVLTFNGITLKEETDYTLAFASNTDAGDATATITGKGNFTGSMTATFKIGPADIAGAKLSPIPKQTYTGSAICPDVTLKFGEATLVLGTDYTLSYSNNVNAGTATATVTGKGNFTGSIKGVAFEIAPADIKDAKLAAIPDQTYTGGEICPALTLTFGDAALAKDKDYTLAFENNKEIGTATATITGKGNFTGSVTASFKITEVPLDAKMADSIPDQTYTGKAITPKVSLKWGKQALVEGEDFTVKYKDNTACGVATAVVTAKDGSIFSGSVELTFTIVKSMTDFASDFSLEKIPDQEHTGKAITPKIVLKDGDKTLKEGTDYTLSYENNVKVGTATVKIAGKGAYSGTLSATFAIKAKPASSSGSSSSGSSSSSSSASSSESSFIGDDSYTPQEQLVLYGLGQASDLYADESMENSLSIVFDDENDAKDYSLTIVETPAQGAQQAQNALLVEATDEAQAAPRHLDLSLAQANRLHNGQNADLLIFRNGGAALSVAFEDLFSGDLAKLARLALDNKLDDALEAAQGDLSSALEGLDEVKLAYSDLAKVRFTLHLDPVFGPDGSVTGYDVCALLLCGDAALDVTELLPTLRLLLLTDAPEGMLMELTDADGQTSALAEAVAGALLDTDRKSAGQYAVRDHASDVSYEKASSLSELLDLVGLRVDVAASGSYRLTPKE